MPFTAANNGPTGTLIRATLLGMGMPTTASYVMASAVAAPALALLGVEPLVAHMFVFFYAVLSSVTPPVCVGAYTAAGLANADPNKTAFMAVKLALPGFIVPFIFVLAPEILLINVTSWIATIQAIISAAGGVFRACNEHFTFRARKKPTANAAISINIITSLIELTF